jgi:hypothetical protein
MNYANDLTNAESVRATIESILAQAPDSDFATLRVSEKVDPNFAVWAVDMVIKKSKKSENILKVRGDFAPDLSFRSIWIELENADVLPFAKRIAQLILLVHNLRCSVCMPSYSDLYERVSRPL